MKKQLCDNCRKEFEKCQNDMKNKNKDLPYDKEANHYNGDVVRKEWEEGTTVYFKPKSMSGGDFLEGTVIFPFYVNVLLIKEKDSNRTWHVSTQRCKKTKD